MARLIYSMSIITWKLLWFLVFKNRCLKNQVVTVLIAVKESSVPIWRKELYYCVAWCGDTCWVAGEMSDGELSPLGSSLSCLSKPIQGNLKSFLLFIWPVFISSCIQAALTKIHYTLVGLSESRLYGLRALISHPRLHSLCYSRKIKLVGGICNLKIRITSVFRMK